MKIKLQFLGINYQINISIYDKNNNLIYNGQASNNYVFMNLISNNVYRLVAKAPCTMLDTYFYVGSNNIYYFAFPSLYMNDSNKVTFFLTDYFYPSLPIERGEIILWPKP